MWSRGLVAEAHAYHDERWSLAISLRIAALPGRWCNSERPNNGPDSG